MRDFLLPITTLLHLSACSMTQPETARPANDDRAALYAPHFADGEYFNPWRRFDLGFGDFVRVLLTPNPYDKSRPPAIPRVANDGRSLHAPRANPAITWVGHATFIIHDGADIVLTDPHFGDRALTYRRQTPPGVALADLPPPRFAVLSHNHYDHLDEYTVRALPAGMVWFVPAGLGEWFHERGRRHVVELDWWESRRLGRWTVTCVPLQHWSRRLGQPTNSTLWCGWILDSGAHRYFFAGDSGYFHGYREIGRRFPGIDVAMLPIGAYLPRWFLEYQHMDPAEAYRAFRDLGARYLLPSHWGVFDLTFEPLDRPPVDLRRAVRAAGGDMERVRILAVGEEWPLPARARAAGR